MAHCPLCVVSDWPCREDLRADLVAAGLPYLDADLYATLTQSGERTDLRDRVRRELAR